jgi:hypothetical protein
LIDHNKILTNAHVVLDEDGEMLNNYSLCISARFTSKPICKTSLKLLSYDMDKDLALLEPVEFIDL